MKSIAAEIAYFMRGRLRQNLKLLAAYCLFLTVLILSYASLFRYLMLHLEGREYSFIAGVYWTLTVMTTLGFGDITFHTDLGYIFAAVVTVSGVVFLLIILPFGVISLFVAPWIESRLRYRPRQTLPEEIVGHIVIFGYNPTTRLLVQKLLARRIPYVIVTADYQQSLQMEEEENLRVVWGQPTDPKLQADVRIDQARYIIACLNDTENTSICLTLRPLTQAPIAAVVEDEEHIELLKLAGAKQAIPLQRIIGRYLGIRATTRGAMAHVIDSFGALMIAEIPVHSTPFVGQTLAQAQIRKKTGLTVVGIWERGNFTLPSAETHLNLSALLVLAGTREQLDRMEQLTGEHAEDELVFIIGHGRIGCAAANFLDRKPVPYVLIDKAENPLCEEHIAVIGDATSRKLLTAAGLAEAKGLIVTTNDDNANIFLTLSGRHCSPKIRIVARANEEEHVPQLYAAGADFVVSNASVGANILLNIIDGKGSMFLTEGITIFRRDMPRQLVGQTIDESRLRPKTGCSIVALNLPDGSMQTAPPPETRLEEGMQLILIGSPRQEQHFSQSFH